MRKAFLIVLLLGSLLVLTFAVTGCESTGVTTPTATNQFAFLRYTGGTFGAQFAARGEQLQAARAAHRSAVRSNVAPAVVDINPGPIDVYLTSNTGAPGSETKVTTDASGAYHSARLSYDGKKAVFAADITDANGTYSQVFLVDMSNTQADPVQVTTDKEWHYDAELSRDGSKILFLYWDSNLFTYQMGIVPSSGGTETKFAGLADMAVLGPTFTPDGNKIVFENCNEDNLYIINADGTGLTQLTDTGDDRNPSVSPDGTKIVFERETENSSIFIMGIGGELGGTAATRLTSGSYSMDPMFVNDKIVFLTDNDSDGDLDIWGMNFDGTGAAAITDTAENDWFFISG